MNSPLSITFLNTDCLDPASLRKPSVRERAMAASAAEGLAVFSHHLNTTLAGKDHCAPVLELLSAVIVSHIDAAMAINRAMRKPPAPKPAPLGHAFYQRTGELK